MRAFENGVDGVLVAGCLEGGCHFLEGNLIAKKRVSAIGDILRESGIEKERLRMVNISASMAPNLVAQINDMVNAVKDLGPNPIRKSNKEMEIEFGESLPLGNEFDKLNSQ